MSGFSISRNAFVEVKEHAESALRNEHATRERLVTLERWAEAFTHMSWRRRLSWLLLGR